MVLNKKLLFLFFVVILFTSCSPQLNPEVNTTEDVFSDKVVVFVNSYHEGYEWSDDITNSIINTFNDTSVTLHTYYMDTLNNPSEEYKLAAAKNADIFIKSVGADLIITSDDNAFKYLVVPYYQNSSIPVVFCGVNWDVDSYEGMPFNNTDGMVEVVLIDKAIEEIRPYSNGNKIGYLAFDRYSEHLNSDYFKSKLNLPIEKSVFVTNYSDWKEGFISLQDEVDIIILGVFDGIIDFDAQDAKKFISDNVRIPIVVEHAWMIDYALISYSKLGSEQGLFASNRALNILSGVDSNDVLIVKNTEGKVKLNFDMADKLNISFQPRLLRIANIK